VICAVLYLQARCHPYTVYKLRHMSHRALKSARSIFVWRTARKKGRKGKERHKKLCKRYISTICGKAPCKRIFTKFCTSGDMPELIICANFGVEKLRGLGYTGVKFWVLPLKWLVTLTTVLRYRAACDFTTQLLLYQQCLSLLCNLKNFQVFFIYSFQSFVRFLRVSRSLLLVLPAAYYTITLLQGRRFVLLPIRVSIALAWYCKLRSFYC